MIYVYSMLQGCPNSEESIEDEMVMKLPEANLVTNLLLIDDIILMLHKVKNENFNFITKQVGFQTKYICFSCKNLTNITRNNNNFWI